MVRCLCNKRAYFNFPEEIVGKWCSKCKPKEAVNIRNNKCKCGKTPLFNLPGEIKGKWCKTCPDIPKEAINVIRKKCECGKHQPYFILPEENIARWCSECPTKPIEALSINKKCECGKHQPNFNMPEETTGKWCSECKPENAVDVIHKRCECGKRNPIYNLPGKNEGKWCRDCKPENAINSVSKLCKECNLTQACYSKYEGYCMRCFIYLFPDKPVTFNYKIKENHVFDAVIELLPKNITLLRDKQVGGCSKRRPDLMIDLGSHWICAENDENCHKDYDNSCENKRLMELYRDMANRPMILIRFNCDKYSGGQSIFKIHKSTGISIIRSKKEFEERTSVFAELINKYIEAEPPEKAITIEYLYYD